MVGKGKIIYPEFAEIREILVKDDKSNRRYKIITGLSFLILGIVILIGAIMLGNFFGILLSILAFYFIIAGSVLIQSGISQNYMSGNPSIYENGIEWQPNTWDWLYHKKFIHKSKIKHVMINTPVELIQEEATRLYNYKSKYRNEIDDSERMTYDEWIDATKMKVYFVLNDAEWNKFWIWKEEFKDINKFSSAINQIGIKIM